MHCLSCTIEKIDCALIRVDEKVQEIVIVYKAKSYHWENLLDCTDDRTWTDILILFTGNILIDVNLRVKNEDLFIEV